MGLSNYNVFFGLCRHVKDIDVKRVLKKPLWWVMEWYKKNEPKKTCLHMDWAL
jgi:hypothetical protein